MKSGLPFLIDVSRLVGRLMKGRLPTGVDRVALAYVRQYAERSRAFIRDGRFHVVLTEKLSQTLFHLLLVPQPDFKAHAWRLIAQGAAAGIRQRDLSGSVFLNIGHSGLEYHRYPDLLIKMKVKPVFLVHDLIPITHPEYCRPGEQAKHRIRMKTVLELAQGVITNSRATLDELARFADTLGMRLPPAQSAFLAPPAFSLADSAPPVTRPYFVVLGTIEPRKNHLLLLQVWKRLVERLGDQAPLLVLIGQRGWECENAVDLLERCEAVRSHVIEHPSCSDKELANWLQHARALLFPSFAEGFGLPLVEALACGTPVIASDLAVFHEIAGNLPDYCDPLDGLGWLGLIADYSSSNSKKRALQLQRVSSYSAPSWEMHFQKVEMLLQKVMSK